MNINKAIQILWLTLFNKFLLKIIESPKTIFQKTTANQTVTNVNKIDFQKP